MASMDTKDLLTKIREIEATQVSRHGARITIRELGKAAERESERLLIASDALMPVLRTALAINWRESAMKNRYDRFRSLFPDIDTLAKLKAAIDGTEAIAFCRNYLWINATSEANPKYRLLKGLTNGFIAYQHKCGLESEMPALRRWAGEVDPSRLKSDHIGAIPGVGIGVVENIRLNLGLPVIKPDRHVVGVVRKFLGIDTPQSEYGSIADSLGIGRRYFDSILFEYGKNQGISA